MQTSFQTLGTMIDWLATDPQPLARLQDEAGYSVLGWRDLSRHTNEKAVGGLMMCAWMTTVALTICAVVMN